MVWYKGVLVGAHVLQDTAHATIPLGVGGAGVAAAGAPCCCCTAVRTRSGSGEGCEYPLVMPVGVAPSSPCWRINWEQKAVVLVCVRGSIVCKTKVIFSIATNEPYFPICVFQSCTPIYLVLLGDFHQHSHGKLCFAYCGSLSCCVCHHRCKVYKLEIVKGTIRKIIICVGYSKGGARITCVYSKQLGIHPIPNSFISSHGPSPTPTTCVVDMAGCSV